MQKVLQCTVRGSTSLFYVIIVCCEDIYKRGGGGTPLYKPKRYVPPQRVGFLSRFGLKTGIDFAHWTGIGYDFRGTYGSV